MPCIAGSFNHQIGPLIQVAIIKEPENIDAGVPHEPCMFMGLIDTGATTTCISSKVIEDCHLEPTGKTLMVGATGQEEVDQFTFGVGFIIDGNQATTGTFKGTLQALQVQGCQFSNHSDSVFDVLIGRDIISRGSITLSFDGHFILSI